MLIHIPQPVPKPAVVDDTLAQRIAQLEGIDPQLIARLNSLDLSVKDLPALKAAVAQGPQFATSTIMTVAETIAAFPASQALRGKYVRVSDLFGYIDGVMRCSFDTASGMYFWQPTTPEYGRSVPVTADMTLNPLTSPTSLNLTGSILVGVTRTINLGTINGRPGETKEIRNTLGSLLGVLNINATGIGAVLALGLNAYAKYFLDASSGTLKWVRLV